MFAEYGIEEAALNTKFLRRRYYFSFAKLDNDRRFRPSNIIMPAGEYFPKIIEPRFDQSLIPLGAISNILIDN